MIPDKKTRDGHPVSEPDPDDDDVDEDGSTVPEPTPLIEGDDPDEYLSDNPNHYREFGGES